MLRKVRRHPVRVFQERWQILANLIWPILIIGVTIFSTPFWDSFVVNARYVISGGASEEDFLVIVKVDEFARLQHNIQEITPRSYIAGILDETVAAGAHVIALNYLFTIADTGYVGNELLMRSLQDAKQKGVTVIVPEIIDPEQGSVIPPEEVRQFVKTGFAPFQDNNIYSTRYFHKDRDSLYRSLAYATVAYSTNQAAVPPDTVIIDNSYYLDFVPTDARNFAVISSESLLKQPEKHRRTLRGRTVLVGSTYQDRYTNDVFTTPQGLLRSTDLQALAIRSLWIGYLVEVPNGWEVLLWVVLIASFILIIYRYANPIAARSNELMNWSPSSPGMWLSIGMLLLFAGVSAILFLSGIKAIPVQVPILVGAILIIICNYVPFPSEQTPPMGKMTYSKRK
ncbi:MAG: CHASE2 domain-containing protein [Rhodothermaceae bacterium]|nr:CHASE2 domain-containing protein [Rhodothermaceae bacterium]